MSVFGGRNEDSAGAFRQATHLPNAQIYVTRVSYFLRLAENTQSVILHFSLLVTTNVACKMNVFQMFWSSGALESNEKKVYL